MKTGLAICAFILTAVAGLFMLELREPIDLATDATAEDKLQRSALADDLPTLFEASEVEGDGVSFTALLSACEAAAGPIASGDEAEQIEQADAVCAALVASLSTGPYDDSFTDRLVPPFDLFSDDLRQLFRVTMLAVNHRFARLMDGADYDAADQLARAHFELGRRVFTQNTRLRARQHGLGLMHSGLSQARQVAQAMAQDIDPETPTTEETQTDDVELDLQAWEQAVVSIDTQWGTKLGWISSARPNVADLVRVAEHDGDRSFRVYATHQLGYARFECGEPGNQRMIALAIERASASEDALIRQAARFAQRMNREQFYAVKP